ncbi:MAG: DinB family protein [Planctomycetes bacterium]|nr:DinB family protein [Planctomycetota bacterium]
MNAKAVVKSQLQSGDELIGKFTQDLTEEEFLFTLPNDGQSVIWILGHLACTEDWALHGLTGSAYQLPEDLHAKVAFRSKPSGRAEDYPRRKEIEKLFRAQRRRTLSALRKSKLREWKQPAPQGFPPSFPSVGALWAMLGSHLYWHIGQITVIRRMLKKPPVLGG